jgi:hypothetical protein
LLCRDEGRGSEESLAICDDLKKGRWRVEDLTVSSGDQREPGYAIALRQKKKQFHAFVQRVAQRDSEAVANVPAEMVLILEWQPETPGRPTRSRMIEWLFRVSHLLTSQTRKS